MAAALSLKIGFILKVVLLIFPFDPNSRKIGSGLKNPEVSFKMSVCLSVLPDYLSDCLSVCLFQFAWIGYLDCLSFCPFKFADFLSSLSVLSDGLSVLAVCVRLSVFLPAPAVSVLLSVRSVLCISVCVSCPGVRLPVSLSVFLTRWWLRPVRVTLDLWFAAGSSRQT